MFYIISHSANKMLVPSAVVLIFLLTISEVAVVYPHHPTSYDVSGTLTKAGENARDMAKYTLEKGKEVWDKLWSGK
ncbi:hypothetical protein KIN20_037192 [Parelaphostrongylus tenuis]|uniref:Salivary secreted peptide n=1 Tax=Parelaphostrongylus tenuis TaxID=148309 RepID=A0AAD5RDY4_PARTN|nr:hypothetical protein KIN20_037192 [Parelaphostrongylus tenuis]